MPQRGTHPNYPSSTISCYRMSGHQVTPSNLTNISYLIIILIQFPSIITTMPKKSKRPNQSSEPSHQLSISSYTIANGQNNGHACRDLHDCRDQHASSPVGRTQYICLTNDDLIYVGNMQRLQSWQFQKVLEKITGDLNLLLYFKDKDFWNEVKTCPSLRKCLASCLQILPRHRYSDHRTLSPPEYPLPTPTPPIFPIFQHLQKIILMLYHRIVSTRDQQNLYFIYDEWLMDMPKLFNLIAIYKETNFKIVNQIVNTLLTNISSYRQDILDFVSIVAKLANQTLNNDRQFKYNKKVLTSNKNFNNPTLTFTRSLVKAFFYIYDIFNMLVDFLDFFPLPSIQLFLAEPDLLQHLIDLYFQYQTNISGRWEFLPEFYEIFAPTIESMRQKIFQFFVKSFDAIDHLLKTYESKNRDGWLDIIIVYFLICKTFSRRNQYPDQHQHWQLLINTIISQTPHRNIFPSSSSQTPFPLAPEQLQYIKDCQEYEANYREHLRNPNFSKQEIIGLKLQKIPSFKEWLDFENYKSFDVMVEDDFFNEESLKDDSILLMMESEMFKMHGQKQKKSRNRSKAIQTLGEPLGEYDDEPELFLDEDDNFHFSIDKLQDLPIDANLTPGQKFDLSVPPPTVTYNPIMYAEYYNKPQLNMKKDKKGKEKKTYIGYDELSIQYQKEKKGTSQIVVESFGNAVKSSMFKSTPTPAPPPPPSCSPITSSPQLSLSKIENNSELQRSISFQNLMEQLDKSELTIQGYDMSQPKQMQEPPSLEFHREMCANIHNDQHQQDLSISYVKSKKQYIPKCQRQTKLTKQVQDKDKTKQIINNKNDDRRNPKKAKKIRNYTDRARQKEQADRARQKEQKLKNNSSKADSEKVHKKVKYSNQPW